MIRVEAGSHKLVGCIVDTPQNKSVILPKQRDGIRQSRDILADFLRISVVLLELYPLVFFGQGPERMYQT